MWEVTLKVDPDRAEELDEFLAENEVEGWHVFVEPHARLAFLTGYFESESSAHSAWAGMRKSLPDGMALGDASFQVLQDRDWQESYKEHFHRWNFGGLHWVPVWEKGEFEPPAGGRVVWLDPGMAFGTGNHETTRLCVERMVEARRQWIEQGKDLREVEVLDAGCGSGILAISAAKCGFGKVAGFDLDPVAVDVSHENAELNELAGQVEFYQGDLVNGLQERRADLVLANIQADVLCSHARELTGAVKPGGCLVLSGILAEELAQVEEVFRRILPEAEFTTHQLGEWADLVAKLP